MPRKPWKFPTWMQPYVLLIAGGSGDPRWIEELMNDHETAVQINAPRALMCASIKAQVGILTSLHERGLLKEGS